MAPGFGSDFVVLIEQNRRRSSSYVEDFVIEAWRNMAQRRDARWYIEYFPNPLRPLRSAGADGAVFLFEVEQKRK